MYNIPYCPMLYTLLYTYILLPPFIHFLIYTLIYYISPHILHHSYILLYIPSLIYLLYTYYILSLLLFPNSITNLAPPFYTYSLLYTILLYTYLPPPFFTTLLYTLCCPSSYILLYILSYMEKGITTLPPIFTRFTSLS
jgi:hypothetical protein